MYNHRIRYRFIEDGSVHFRKNFILNVESVLIIQIVYLIFSSDQPKLLKNLIKITDELKMVYKIKLTGPSAWKVASNY